MPASSSEPLHVEAAAAHFRDNFTHRGELGASVSVWGPEGELLSLADGFEDPSRSKPWQTSSRVLVWSATKGVSAACLLHALENTNLPLDSLVSRLWPEFAAAGKQDVTLRMILQHQSGLCALESPLPAFDHEAIAHALAAQAPAWKPGSSHGYHPRTFGFLLEELMRRLGAGSIGTYWRQALADPLDLDFHIGLPESLAHTVAPVQAPRGNLPKDDPFLNALLSPGTLTARAFAHPKGLQYPSAMNKPEARIASFPGWGGIGTAAALAKFYAVLAADGCLGSKRFFAEKTLREIHSPGVQGPDPVLQLETAFSVGFMRDPVTPDGLKKRRTFGPSAGSFGHPGAGGSVAFADPVRRIGCAYVMNQMEPGVLPNLKSSGLWSALYGSH
jgi:CubicO group peptidase (beta-lactamase class C family)